MSAGDAAPRLAMWFERLAAGFSSQPAESYSLRVTHVYRRENGE